MRGWSSSPTGRTSSRNARQGPGLRPSPARARSTRGPAAAAGTLDKPATRAHAERLGLLVADKTESQDICFVEGGDYRDILARVAPSTMVPGDIRTVAGDLVGAHAGIANYTVGQRRGLPANTEGRAM